MPTLPLLYHDTVYTLEIYGKLLFLSRVEVTTLFLMGEGRVHLDFYAPSSLFTF